MAGGTIAATTLTITAGTLDMATYDLSVTAVTNNGTIKTQSTSGIPLTTGLTWGGTVNYNAASGIQTVASGSYNNLTATTASARTLKFSTLASTTVTGIWTVTGSPDQLITLTSSSAPSQWTIIPTAAAVSYADINYSINSGTAFCATYSKSTNGNNTSWQISSGSSCNTAPSFSGNPTDSPDPVVTGHDVTFSGTATDSADNWYLAVCKTDSITAGTPPTCASSQTYCVSSSAVGSGSPNTCTWTSTGSTAQDWYAFACDNNVSPLCSSANTVNSPITVNAAVISVTVDPATTSYGVMPTNEVKKADTANANDEFIVTNNSTNVAEDFDIVGSDATGGAGWTLSPTSTGSSIFMHAYSTLKTLAASFTLGSSGEQATKWVALDKGSNYRPLASNIAINGTVDLILELLSPTDIGGGDYGVTKNTTVTIRATEH